MEKKIDLRKGDCLTIMKDIPTESVDMILCDLPYGLLNSNSESRGWDKRIPMDVLWREYKRIIKPHGAIVLFGTGMFTAELMTSQPKMWRYNLIWKKGNRTSGFLNANRQPLRNHEDVLVFSKKSTIYNPQMTQGEKNHARGKKDNGYVATNIKNRCYDKFKSMPTVFTNRKFPISILNFEKEHPQIHPTQKPVALLEYLIKTYTDEDMLVLDNCMGSGSTGIACINTKRKFLGIELDSKWFAICDKRINEHLIKKCQLTLFDMENDL